MNKELLLGLVLTSTLVIIYTVGIIGVDRFLYIFYGYHSSKWPYLKIIQSSVIIVWILSEYYRRLIGDHVAFFSQNGWKILFFRVISFRFVIINRLEWMIMNKEVSVCENSGEILLKIVYGNSKRSHWSLIVEQNVFEKNITKSKQDHLNHFIEQFSTINFF